MRVLLAGGGSGGSSAPVLAVAQELRRREPCDFLYVGTAEGPEREMVARLGIPFHTVQTGKLRRYWSPANFTDLFRLPLGLAQSLRLVASFRPDVAFAAGGFAAVPPLLAASLLRVPTVIHQQDVEPGLANRILTPFATAITVAFPDSLAHFPPKKTRVTGNPVREEILAGSRAEGLRLFGFEDGLPVVLATGGGTGALGLNRLVAAAAPTLAARCQILHITGRGKSVPVDWSTEGVGERESGRAGESEPGTQHPALSTQHSALSTRRYRQVEFLAEGMGHALAAAALVISRAGLSTLTEIAALGKPSILIPMPHSHQEANARAFSRPGAAVLLEEDGIAGATLAGIVLDLLANPDGMQTLADHARALMPIGAERGIAELVRAVAGEG